MTAQERKRRRRTQKTTQKERRHPRTSDARAGLVRPKERQSPASPASAPPTIIVAPTSSSPALWTTFIRNLPALIVALAVGVRVLHGDVSLDHAAALLAALLMRVK